MSSLQHCMQHTAVMPGVMLHAVSSAEPLTRIDSPCSSDGHHLSSHLTNPLIGQVKKITYWSKAPLDTVLGVHLWAGPASGVVR